METTCIDDPTIAAAVITINKGLRATPFKNSNGRVAFELNKDDLSDEIRRIYAGESAPLRDYMRNLKELRSAIFSLKTSR